MAGSHNPNFIPVPDMQSTDYAMQVYSELMKIQPFLQALPICFNLLNQELSRFPGLWHNQGFGSHHINPHHMANFNSMNFFPRPPQFIGQSGLTVPPGFSEIPATNVLPETVGPSRVIGPEPSEIIGPNPYGVIGPGPSEVNRPGPSEVNNPPAISGPLEFIGPSGYNGLPGFNAGPSNLNSNNVKMSMRLYIPEEEIDPNNMIADRVLGSECQNARLIEATTGCRVFIKGKGSIKGLNVIMENWLRNRHKFLHLNEPQHFAIEADLPASIIVFKLKEAQSILEDLAKPMKFQRVVLADGFDTWS